MAMGYAMLLYLSTSKGLSLVRHAPEIQEVSIVVVGDFSPDTITPLWLAYHELISQPEAEEATVRTSTFSTQIDLGWGKFYVDPNRAQLLTSQSPWIRAYDFVLKFLELIPSNAASAVGINLARHFPLSSDEREKLGHMLAPRKPWGTWGELLNNKESPENGLVNITMRQGANLGAEYNSYVDAKVSTSPILKAAGIRIYINDHYSFSDEPKSKLSTSFAVQTLEKQFDVSLARSGDIIDGIVDGIKS